MGCDNMKKLSHVFGVISSNLFVWGFFLIRTKENERRDVQSNRHLTWRCISSDLYRKHLDFKDLNLFQYQSSVQWFDQNILSKLQNEHKIIQIFSFEKPNFELHSGKIFPQALYPNYFENMRQGIPDENLFNHMTPDQNENLAESLSFIFKTL